MAGVKAHKDNGGKSLATRWRGANCHACGASISELKQAWRVRWITLERPRKTAMVWQHRTCQGGR